MKNGKRSGRESDRTAINEISLRGYKSIAERVTLEIRPLTVLAGANSSGKSSIMQPLLLIKQTMEAQYDPGGLLIDGACARFTSAAQIFSKIGTKPASRSFTLELCSDASRFSCRYEPRANNRVQPVQQTVTIEGKKHVLRPEMPANEAQKAVPKDFPLQFFKDIRGSWSVELQRAFLALRFQDKKRERVISLGAPELGESLASDLIYVPASRGRPERTYRVTSAGPTFPGSFEHYVASVIHHWKSSNDNRLGRLELFLRDLGLTNKVDAHQVEDTRLEVRVGRLPGGRKREMVSLADVGFGVSQVLPVLVATLAAAPGQLLYIEQPEIHLHPRAQIGLANVLADAAKRGVRVIVETHSARLLLAIRSLVAEDETSRNLDSNLVKLHWFQRTKATGVTHVRSANLDELGAFGDWPEDFGVVELEQEGGYLDLVESRALRFQ